MDVYSSHEGSIMKSSYTLPRELNIEEYATARLQEMDVLVDHISKSKRDSKNLFQDFPLHMRRRAASHNVKRLPRRVRERAEKKQRH